MPISVRTATVADITDIVRLNRDIQDIHVDLDPDIFSNAIEASEFTEFWQGVFADETNTVLVADLDCSIVGYAWIQVQTRPRTVFNHPRRRVYIHHVGVDSSHRRQRTGSLLLRATEAFASDNGIDKIVLDCWSSNNPAQSFFSRSGFTPLNVVLSKTLITEAC